MYFMKNILCVLLVSAVLLCLPFVCSAEKPDKTGYYEKPSGFSKSELNNIKGRFSKPSSVKPDADRPGLNFNKLNPLSSTITPRKNVKVSFFSSMREIFVFSILGLFGLVSLSGAMKFYRIIRNKRSKKSVSF